MYSAVCLAAYIVSVCVHGSQPKPENCVCRLVIDVLTVEEESGIIAVQLIASLISAEISLADWDQDGRLGH